MTSEVTVLALAAILQVVQIGLAGAVVNRDAGPEWAGGPRDRPVELSTLAGRLRRAVDNHFEGLILFTIAVVVVTLGQAQGSFTATAAWLYLAARILYIPAYAFGWSPWRSVIWAVGALATLAMIVSAFF